VAINLITQEDYRKLRELEEFYSTAIEELPKEIGHLLN